MAYALRSCSGFDSRACCDGSIALGLNMGGYGGEIVRGAIQSVPGPDRGEHRAQPDGVQRIRYVILPQAMRVILPPMGNLTIEILKGTALVSLISLSDLAFEARKLRTSGRLNPDAPSDAVLFLNAPVIYFVVAQIINGLFRLAEWRVNRRFEAAAAHAVELVPATPPGATG